MSNEATRSRLNELLPDYILNKLDEKGRQWVDDQVAASASAAAALKREKALADAVRRSVDETSVDACLRRAMAMIDAGEAKTAADATEAALDRERALSQTIRRAVEETSVDASLDRATAMIEAHEARKRSRSLTPGLLARMGDWLDGLMQPRYATAMLAIIAVQSAVIGWQVLGTREDDRQMRTVVVAELRTVRVKFDAAATSAQINQALIAAGARMAGGPNQFGDYWLSSPIRSQQEMRDSLLASGVVTSAEDDNNGPPRQ